MNEESQKLSLSEIEESIVELKKVLDKLYKKTIQALVAVMPECAKNEIDRRIDSGWRELKKLNDSGELIKLKSFVKDYLENVQKTTLEFTKSETNYPHTFNLNEYQNQNSNIIDQDINYIFKQIIKNLDANLGAFGLLRENRANRYDYPDATDVMNFRGVADIGKIENLENAILKYKNGFSLLIKKCDELRNCMIQLEKDEVLKTWNDGKL